MQHQALYRQCVCSPTRRSDRHGTASGSMHAHQAQATENLCCAGSPSAQRPGSVGSLLQGSLTSSSMAWYRWMGGTRVWRYRKRMSGMQATAAMSTPGAMLMMKSTKPR